MNPLFEPPALPVDPPGLWARRSPGAFARWLRATASRLVALGPQRAPPPARDGFDDATGLYNLEGFLRSGDALLQQARLEARTVTLLLFEFADLVEVREIYGRATSHQVQALVLQKVKAIAGPHGLAARTGRTEFAVLLRGERELAEALVHRQLGKPARVELDTGANEVVVVPDIHCTVAAAQDASVAPLYEAAVDQLAGHRAREQRRQLYLQRERERHSRPMSGPSSRG